MRDTIETIICNFPLFQFIVILTGLPFDFVLIIYKLLMLVELLNIFLIFLFFLIYRKDQNFLDLKAVAVTKFSFVENYILFCFTCSYSIPVKMLITNFQVVGIVGVCIFFFLISIRYPFFCVIIIYYLMTFIEFCVCFFIKTIKTVYFKDFKESNHLFYESYSTFFFEDFQNNMLKVIKACSILFFSSTVTYLRLTAEHAQVLEACESRLLVFVKENPDFTYVEWLAMRKIFWGEELNHTIFLKIWFTIRDFDFSFFF